MHVIVTWGALNYYHADCILTRNWIEWVDDRGRTIVPLNNETVEALLPHLTTITIYTLTPPTREMWPHSGCDTRGTSTGGQIMTIIQCNCVFVEGMTFQSGSSIKIILSRCPDDINFGWQNLMFTWRFLHDAAQCVVDDIPHPHHHDNHTGTVGPSRECELHTESSLLTSICLW